MAERLLVDRTQLATIVERIAWSLMERYYPFRNTLLIGLQPRGVLFAQRLMERLRAIAPDFPPAFGALDATLFRDDISKHQGIKVPYETHIPEPIQDSQVILVDDVLFTGRSVRAGLDALFNLGRPASVRLVVLVDRKHNRQVPICPDITGIEVEAMAQERVKVLWSPPEEREGIWLIGE
ncbi:MAG: bifunctional pyr operon transcriptional regulator/uracil phosphoribosyltransferase PyrR [Chlorobi bacterium]|nr:bifunctional pyr operon transcriptional regulator/uracil phosphoribosyltransferase PyrR [Chlorobiota bacterium]